MISNEYIFKDVEITFTAVDFSVGELVSNPEKINEPFINRKAISALFAGLFIKDNISRYSLKQIVEIGDNITLEKLDSYVKAKTKEVYSRDKVKGNLLMQSMNWSYGTGFLMTVKSQEMNLFLELMKQYICDLPRAESFRKRNSIAFFNGRITWTEWSDYK